MPKAKNPPKINPVIEIDWEKDPSESQPISESETETVVTEEPVVPESQPTIENEKKSSTMICENCLKPKEDCANHYGKILCAGCHEEEKEKRKLERERLDQLKSANNAEIAQLKAEVSELRRIVQTMPISQVENSEIDKLKTENVKLRNIIERVKNIPKREIWDIWYAHKAEAGYASVVNWYTNRKNSRSGKAIGEDLQSFVNVTRSASLGIIPETIQEYIIKIEKS